jgi:SAM-dependent methyltransferase
MSAPDKPNNLYWQTRPGESYQATQAHRRANPENSYDAQEQWLRRVLAEWSAVHPRPLRLLDVGCGFGRLAHLCADVGGVDWFGFDFSSTMIQPLLDDPPAAYAADIADRVRVADSLDAAFPGETFDLVITISVMIHNDEADARALLDSMRRRRAPDGEIILIENLPVEGSGFTNDWHAGCWMHDIVAYASADEFVIVDFDMHAQHGVYRLSVPQTPGLMVVVRGYRLRLSPAEFERPAVLTVPHESGPDDLARAQRLDQAELESIRTSASTTAAKKSPNSDT